MKKLPALKRMKTLTQDQRVQIVAWLEEGKSYRWIIKQTAKPLDQGGFGEAVPQTCLWRFNKRRLALHSAKLKKSIGDLSQIAKDINHYAATGEAGLDGHGFHSATLVLIEKQALELALDQSDHDRLKDLFRMKLAHENTQTRKIYTTHRVQLDQDKQALRREQFEYKKSLNQKPGQQSAVEPEPIRKDSESSRQAAPANSRPGGNLNTSNKSVAPRVPSAPPSPASPEGSSNSAVIIPFPKVGNTPNSRATAQILQTSQSVQFASHNALNPSAALDFPSSTATLACQSNQRGCSSRPS